MIRENVKKLLEYAPHGNQWLLDQWSIDLETQVFVKPGTADQAHHSKTNCWTNGVHTWKQIRWPYNSGTTPNFKDFVPEFPLADYVESIGTTWWNWVTGESHAIVVDVDSVITHGVKRGSLNEDELKDFIKKIEKLDYVTIIRSTSGTGYHILIFFEEGYRPKVANHHEHTLVAKVTLAKMSEDAGFDLSESIDCYGAIGWIWSTRATPENQGFAMIKQASRNLKADDLADWTKIPAKRMHLRPKIVAYDDSGNEISGNNILGLDDEIIEINNEHKKIIRALEKTEFSFSYVMEHNLFHTHTSSIKKVHKDLNLKGPFETTTGETTACNCYIRPMKGGGFWVGRFGQHTAEHQLWDQRGQITWCTFNQAIPAHQIILKMGGEYIAEQKCYKFETIHVLLKCTQILGNKVPLKLREDREYTMLLNGRGCILVCRCDKDLEPAGCDGWERVKGYYKKVLSRLEDVDVDSILARVDSLVRYTVRKRNAIGWTMNTKKGWTKAKADDVLRVVRLHVGKEDSAYYMEIAADNPWELVNEPFKPKQLPGREWNLDGAQLVVPCSEKSGPHPLWDRMLEHVGQSLNDPISDDEYLRSYGIFTGADYLRAWIACLIRYPEQPLPYMFLIGPQNTGKSLCHEVLRDCFINGVVHGGNAMISGSGFNGEFEGKVLAAIDETDLSASKGMIARLKAWANATYISIHIKGQQPFEVPNRMHWWQTAQSETACIIEQGDTRIIVLDVPAFEGEEIPKLGPHGYIKQCLREFPNFLYTLGTMQIPPATGRTRLPIISTEIKEGILDSTEPEVFEFIKSMYHDVPGHFVRITEAYDGYKKWCQADNRKPIRPNDFKLQVGLKYPIHRGPSGRAFSIGNLSLSPDAPPKPAFTKEGKDGRHERASI